MFGKKLHPPSPCETGYECFGEALQFCRNLSEYSPRCFNLCKRLGELSFYNIIVFTECALMTGE